MKNKIFALDLFCGAGGLTRGMLDAGIDVVAGIDIDTDAKFAYETNNIRQNGKSCQYIQQDITTISPATLKKLLPSRRYKKFLLAGCAPCQPFSRKNNKDTKTDSRKTLLEEFAKLVSSLTPDLVFMENVPGLPKLAPRIFTTFCNTLKKEGFKYIQYGVIDAKWYGVPQNRKRFVLLAAKTHSVSIPTPIFTEKTGFCTVYPTIAKLPVLKAGEQNAKDELHRSAGLSPLNLRRVKIIKKNRSELPEELVLACHKHTTGHHDAYGRMDPDKPAPTLTTRFFSITTGRYIHPTQNRAISLREGALLQTFPKNYQFRGSMQSIAKQIGNAVPPKMAKELISAFVTGNTNV